MHSRTAGGAMTLPGKYYTSALVYSQEQKRIFGERWLCIGRNHALQAPGSYELHDVLDESIIVLRAHNGELRAFYNVCRHRGTQICTEASGKLRNSMQCPYHAWTYGLDGSLIGAPQMDGVPGFDRADYGLKPVAVAEWEGLVFVNLSAEPQPFSEVYAPLLDKFPQWHLPELQIVERIVYDVEANWKLIFQNYNECYHCPTLHPVLNQLTPYTGAWNDLEEGPILGGPMVLSAESMTMTGRVCATPFADLSDEELGLVFYYTIFPTLFLSLHPDYVLIHRCVPLAPNKTRIICEWLFHPDEVTKSDFDPSGAVEFWNMTNKQDWHICELSQRGVQSRAYTPGPYSELESVLAAFDREYLAALG
jgi:Rieske 2Fe-2S family protein